MGWKYVIIEVRLGNRQTGTKILMPVIFPDKLNHDMMAMGFKAVLDVHGIKHGKPVSAGKIEHIEVDGLGGDSVTLQMQADPDDERVINTYSYTHGVKV